MQMNEKSSGLNGHHPNGEQETALLDRVRQRLQGKRGAKYWRSLEQLAETEEFRELLHREFPRHASEWDTNFDRRKFLQLSSASLALAGLTACTKQPPEKIMPYVRQPEQIVPGMTVRLDDDAWPRSAQMLVLGTVERIDDDPDKGLRKIVTVRPTVEIERVKEVTFQLVRDEDRGGDG